MGIEDGGNAGDLVYQVIGCSLSIKWYATVKTINRPISLCETALNIVKMDSYAKW